MKVKNEPRLPQTASAQDGEGLAYPFHILPRQTVLRQIFVAIAALIGFAFLPASPAFADGTGEPETVFLGLAASSQEEAAPAPSPRPWRPEVSEDDAEILARLLWSSPLTNETDKRRLCWVVFNRIDDESPLFGLTVADVVIKREFTFFDHKAHLSETNLRIARDELARWTAMLMGIPVERPLPEGYVYAGFKGHSVSFYTQIGGEPWNGE